MTPNEQRLLAENTRLRNVIEATEISVGKLKARVRELEEQIASRNMADEEASEHGD